MIMSQAQATPTAPLIDWQLLHTLLSEDKSTTEALVTALSYERELLTSRNYDALTSALTDKALLIQQLEKRSQTRQKFLQNAGFESEKELLATADIKQPKIASAWRELATLWQHCQTQNQVNDQIVRRTRIVIQRVLDILHGQPDMSRTYNLKGESHKGYTGKAIASA
jgi:flagellar biosynthesis/type III secretory pathway chaperone